MWHVAAFRSSRLFGAGWTSVSAAARLATTRGRMVVSVMVSIFPGAVGGSKILVVCNVVGLVIALVVSSYGRAFGCVSRVGSYDDGIMVASEAYPNADDLVHACTPCVMIVKQRSAKKLGGLKRHAPSLLAKSARDDSHHIWRRPWKR
jgi:hypothetical protein